MIWHIAVLLLCQLAGEVIVKALGVGIPGPVLGMAFLVIILVLRPVFAEHMKTTANGLLAHLSLLFVPAGVGIIGHLGRLGSDGVGIVVAIVASTVLAIAVAALVFVGVARLTGHAGE